MTFPAGSPVRVADDWPEARGPVHCRTPHYLRGRRGTVVRHLGTFPDPGDIAFARPPVPRELYHVAFAPAELWPDASADDLVVEVYGHWLEPSEPAEHAQRPHAEVPGRAGPHRRASFEAPLREAPERLAHNSESTFGDGVMLRSAEGASRSTRNRGTSFETLAPRAPAGEAGQDDAVGSFEPDSQHEDGGRRPSPVLTMAP